MDFHELYNFATRWNLLQPQDKKDLNDEMSTGLLTYLDGVSGSTRPLWSVKEQGPLGCLYRKGRRKLEPGEHSLKRPNKESEVKDE